MTVLFRKLRLFGYRAFRFTSQQGWPRFHNTLFSSHSAYLGRWRTRDRRLLCQPISAPHTMSVTTSHNLRPHACTRRIDRFPNRFVYSLFSGGAFNHRRFAYLAVRHFLLPRVYAKPLPAPYRLSSETRPWMDALSLLVMAISWLGKSGSLHYASTGADPSIALAAWTRLVIGFPCQLPPKRVKLTLACSDINGPTDCFSLGSSRTRTKHGTSAQHISLL